LTHGVGGLNIDGTRVGTETITINTFDNGAKPFGDAIGEPYTSKESQGRWPANIILDEFTAELLDEQSGVSKDGTATSRSGQHNGYDGGWKAQDKPAGYGGQGGASRFFYVAKANKRDRNEGLDELPLIKGGSMNGAETREGKPTNHPVRQNFHPTVKPTALMQYLIRLVTPEDGVVLDPFAGSGSTGKAAILENKKFIGIELTAEYLPIIEGRLNHANETRIIEGGELFE
jgi:site-specific DNA-methyltransferase (adenine-specific)